VDLNREAGIPIDLNLFEVMAYDAPGDVPAEQVAEEIRNLIRCQRQRAHQAYERTKALHHPLPPNMSTKRALEMIEAYFGVGRGVLWKFNLEALASTKRTQTRSSVQWLAAVQVFRQMTAEHRAYVRRSVSDTQLALNWEKLRVAYSVDPALHRALIDTDPGGSPIPPQILRQLPHADPVFLLPQGIPVVLADGSEGTTWAFFVRGLGLGQYSTSTADETASHYQICALSSIGRPGGTPTDWDLSGVSVPLDHEFTVDSASDLSAAEWDAVEVEKGDRGQVRAWTRTILRICLPVLMYCCSVNADLQAAARPVRPPRKSGKRQAEKAAPTAQTYSLGYRVGPALTRTAERRSQAVLADRADSPGGTTGRRRRTHIRRAHWHTYWYGPRDGVREARLKWVAMRVINEDLADQATTVIPVR